MATLLSNLGSALKDDLGHRKTLVLSDGSIVCFVRTNSTTITAYHSSDRVTFASKFTITVSVDSPFSCAVDSADNIQIVYQTTNLQNLMWRRYSFAAGPTWTAGTAETVVAASANNAVSYADIDVLGTGATVGCVVIYRIKISTTQYIVMRGRGTGGSWGTAAYLKSGTVASNNSAKESVSISRDLAGVVSGNQRFYYAGIFVPLSPTIGGIDGTVNVTVATGDAITFTNSASTWTEHIPYGTASAYLGNNVLTFPISNNTWYGVEFYYFKNGLCTVRTWKVIWTGTVLTKTFTSERTLYANTQTTPTKPTAVLMSNGKIACFTRAGQGVTCIIFDPQTGFVSPWFWYINFNFSWTPFAGAQRNVTTIADVILFDPGSGVSYHEENHSPAQSTVTTPQPDYIFNTDLPWLHAAVPVLQHGSWVRKVEFTIANDTGFSTNVKALVEPDASLNQVLIHSLNTATVGQELSQGIRYIRVRTIDGFGRISGWSSTIQFQVFHPPTSSNFSPANNAKVAYPGTGLIPINWDFVDTSPTDYQTAYQIIIEKNEDGTLVGDTGKIISSSSQSAPFIAAELKDIDLRWKVSLWDSDDVQGPFSGYNVFAMGDAPVISIISPAEGGVVDHPAPFIDWTFTSIRPQKQYGILITKRSTGRFIYSSGVVQTSDTFHQIPSSALVNDTDYSIFVTAMDTYGLNGDDTNLFTTEWIAPAFPEFTIDTSFFDSEGYNLIQWTNAEIDPEFYSYRIYRRIAGEEIWSLVTDQTANVDSYSFADYILRANTTYEYVVIQVAMRFGALVESVYTNSEFVTSSSDSYWLLHPTDFSKNFKLSQVTSESVTDEYESEVLNIIGRGRKVDYGSYLGHSGNLSCQIYDQSTKTARQIKLELEALQATRSEVYLRNPFGDLYKVDLGNASISRIAGVGTREFHTLDLPYVELDVENDIFKLEAVSTVLLDGLDGGELYQVQSGEVDGGSP